jgi:hypothetical protein
MAILAAGILLIARPFSKPLNAGTIDQTSNTNFNTAYYQLYVDQSLPAPTRQSLEQAQGPQLSFTVTPTGGVFAPTSGDTIAQTGPLTILSSFPSTVDLNASKSLGLLSGSSTGFEQDNNGSLADLVSSDNTKFGLIFFGTGFEANKNGQGGLLDFSLAVKKSLTSAPTLTPDEPGVHIIGPLPLLPPPSAATGESTGATSTASPGGSSSGTTKASPGGSSSGTSTSGSTTLTSQNIPEPISVVVWSVLGGLGLIRARAMRPRRSAA